MDGISSVVNQMDALVADFSKGASPLGYFAVLYRQVTLRVKEGLYKQEFEDAERMEKLVVYFAQRYFDALEMHRNNQKPSLSWLRAFEAATKGRHLLLQHLLLGINAHINLDLGIAAVKAVGEQPLDGIKKDFDKINLILAEMVDGVTNNIGKLSPFFWLFSRMARGRDELLVNFSIHLARDGAWRFAQEYAVAKDQVDCIRIRDQVIAGLAESLIQPGKRLQRGLRLIAFTEWRSVPGMMRQLGELTAENSPENL